ncbi:MAG TPA: hypothetical protein VE733_10360 [Streptosporangiaceae bacterium]|nr:hypothetical protein [Streptosporangiaceae bacterium]
MTLLGRVLRGLWPDRNPLRRTIDRLESAVIAGLMVAFLAGAPLAAITVGQWAYSGAVRAERVENAAWHPVTAVVLQGVPRSPANPYGAADVAQVPASWTAPDGTRHTGNITVATGTAKGATATIWTDRSGVQTGPPLGPAQVTDRAALAGALAVFGIAFLLMATGALIHRALDRRRLAAWDAEWDVAGPHWTNHR